jgi:hypothetical protein
VVLAHNGGQGKVSSHFFCLKDDCRASAVAYHRIETVPEPSTCQTEVIFERNGSLKHLVGGMSKSDLVDSVYGKECFL